MIDTIQRTDDNTDNDTSRGPIRAHQASRPMPSCALEMRRLTPMEARSPTYIPDPQHPTASGGRRLVPPRRQRNVDHSHLLVHTVDRGNVVRSVMTSRRIFSAVEAPHHFEQKAERPTIRAVRRRPSVRNSRKPCDGATIAPAIRACSTIARPRGPTTNTSPETGRHCTQPNGGGHDQRRPELRRPRGP